MLSCFQHILLSALIEKDLGVCSKSHTELDNIIVVKKGKKDRNKYI